jgi:hypothetical protein
MYIIGLSKRENNGKGQDERFFRGCIEEHAK